MRFDAYPAATTEDIGLSVELDHELCDDVPVRVLVSPGTLPGSAAQALRQIAAWIERDRRLLSARHWQGVAQAREPQHGVDRPAEPEQRQGDSADQA